jgi:hypothetical protein
VNLGELAPYVVSTDHDGVELALPRLPSETGRLVAGALALVAMLVWATDTDRIISLFLAGALAMCVLFWGKLNQGQRLLLRIEQRQLVVRGHGAIPTTELLRIDTTDTSLQLWRADGTVETLDLPLQNPALLGDLARILQQNVLRHGMTERVPDSLRQLRERSPQ